MSCVGRHAPLIKHGDQLDPRVPQALQPQGHTGGHIGSGLRVSTKQQKLLGHYGVTAHTKTATQAATLSGWCLLLHRNLLCLTLDMAWNSSMRTPAIFCSCPWCLRAAEQKSRQQPNRRCERGPTYYNLDTPAWSQDAGEAGSEQMKTRATHAAHSIHFRSNASSSCVQPWQPRS